MNDLLPQIVEALGVAKGPNRRGDYTAWCPYHGDGEGEPPHRPNLSVGPRGFVCRACGEKGSLKKLAMKLGLAVGQPRKRGPEATWDYHDEGGTLLFQVVRFPGKDFRQRRPDGKGGWIWKLGDVSRVLYRLPELLARPTEPVHVVEGEKDAERLLALGLLATTNPGGAEKWKSEYTERLAGRDVVVYVDNDAAGRKHAKIVVSALHGRAKSVKRLDLPGLPTKGDVSDWLDAGHTPSQLLELIDRTPEWDGIGGAEGADDEGDEAEGADGSSRASQSQAEVLVELALEAGVELFHEEREEPYARVKLKGRSRVLPIESRRFTRFLSQLAWSELEKSPGGEVLSTAARTLGSIACLDRPQIPLSVRHARHDGEIFIDLDGTRAICVGPSGWRVVNSPPILFRSFQHQRPLPEPTRGGDAELVLDFVNLANDDARTLFVNHLVASFVPDVPIAALALHGVQGATKSSLFRVWKRLVDPSGLELRRGARDASELAQALFHNRLLIFDNLSSLPDWMSDALCGAITGDGWGKRALYTNEDDIYFEYQRAIGVGGINLVVEKADLLDRCVLLELHPPRREDRREEREFWRGFEAARPRIFGGLLDRLSRAMAAADGLELRNLPRMADYCRWGEAASQSGGQRPGAFLAAYDRNVNKQSDVAIDASPVGEALVALLARRVAWKGAPAQLYEEMGTIAQGMHIDTRGSGWPKAPNSLTRQLKEIEAPLLARGISVVTTRTGAGRTITITAARGSTVTRVTTDTAAPGQAVGPTSGVDNRDPIPSGGPSPRNRVESAPEPRHDDCVGSDGLPGDDALEAEERAAIREYEAGMPRAAAEATRSAIPVPLDVDAGEWW